MLPSCMDIHQMERPVGSIEFSLVLTEIVILKKIYWKVEFTAKKPAGNLNWNGPKKLRSSEL